MTFECLSQATSPTQIVMLWVTQLYNLGQNEELGESEVARSCPTLCTPWTVDCQAPPPMGFSRQEYWSGLPFPSPGDFPDSGIEPSLPNCRQTLYHLSYQGRTWYLAQKPAIFRPAIKVAETRVDLVQGSNQLLFGNFKLKDKI